AAAAAEARKWARLKAGQIIINDGSATRGNAATTTPASGGQAANSNLANSSLANPEIGWKDTDTNTQFLNGVGNQRVDTVHAVKIRRVDALVAQGTTIPAILESAIDSGLPGMVRAITSDDVWSFDGRRVLIPSGTHLIGQYKSGIAQGQTRVFIVWTRLLRPDGVSVQLGSPGTDAMGRAGNGGMVDNHYLERFGSSILLSVIGGASQLIAGLGQNNQQPAQSSSTSVTNPITGITTTTTTQPSQSSQINQQARQIASQTIAKELTQISQEALKNAINIPPTITLDQGTQIIVFVRRDLDFSSLYPDPVQEALQKLRRDHGVP
ncbi:MAG: type IV secretion system protein VirB10, partial [Hyphomicrobiales bacterium]|nr:type IV secretion system protein VirB10 [Hyphomicrobiales bacterium]